MAFNDLLEITKDINLTGWILNMIELNSELINAMRKFKEVFGDTAPLKELPQNLSNEELIEAIQKSIEQNVNLLPKRFEY